MTPRLALLAALACLVATPALAQGVCQDLWFERNGIYKRAGYCFKTGRAIAAFGNAGCMYDNENEVPLSENDRRRVQSIVREERALGCR